VILGGGERGMQAVPLRVSPCTAVYTETPPNAHTPTRITMRRYRDTPCRYG